MNEFAWIDFYTEFATKLLDYENNRSGLIEKIKEIYTDTEVIAAGIKLPKLEKDYNIVDIDPFTTFALFNKKNNSDKRKVILNRIKNLFDISAVAPIDFDGIPKMPSQSACFYFFLPGRGENDIDNLWELFRYAISYADNQQNEAEFKAAFNTAVGIKNVKWNITMGLYWIRPLKFISLDIYNKKLLKNNQSRFTDIDINKLFKKPISAENYLLLMNKVKEVMTEYNSFPELSLDAWKLSKKNKKASDGKDNHCKEGDEMSVTMTNPQKNKVKYPLNMILYGPAGTGKTYNSVIYAVAIVENKPFDDVKCESYSDYSKVLDRYNKYREKGLIEFTTFHQSYGYEEFIEGIRPIMGDNDYDCTNAEDNKQGSGDSNGDCTDIRYSIEKGLFKAFCENAENDAEKYGDKTPRVFIIDEINRGKISKILGELITLIEDTKRIGKPEGMRVKLPYSQTLFGVPDNVYIIGTMNTADSSIAAIDTALRRRFRFKEIMPDVSVLEGINVEGINIAQMLESMNKRISVLYDREHTIGHAYFTRLKENPNPTIEQLSEIFENAIIPLLQEYFYEDYEKIRFVLGDNKKENKEEQFITVVENNYEDLFGNADIGFDDSVRYEINRSAFHNIEAYKSIC